MGDLQVAGVDRQMRTRGQANQIAGVGHPLSFVKVVDTPHKASVAVAPRAEIFYMQVAYGQGFGRGLMIGAKGGPGLRPAEESGAEKSEGSLAHQRVLAAHVGRDE